MSDPDDEQAAAALESEPVTATMSEWMLVEAFGDECLFGFATSHPATGGLSWTLSTPVIQFTVSASRARTASGRVYNLGRQICARDLDAEGGLAVRLLLSNEWYPGRDGDVAWIVSQKMARHLCVIKPPLGDPVAVERFFKSHLRAYLRIRATWTHDWD